VPLTNTERSQIETLIAKRREALSIEIRQDVARSRNESFSALAGEVRDAGDEAVASLMADTDNAETTRDVHELRELNDAVTRLSDGTYGVCVSCSDDIPFARLKAYPGAVRCVTCQSVHERTHTHPGEPTL
jgi:DnaK suppressor protein